VRGSIGKLVLGDNEELRIFCAALVATVWKAEDERNDIWPQDTYPNIDPATFPTDLDSLEWFNDLRRFIAGGQDPITTMQVSTY
jgi:hypothetical protein